MSHVLLYKKGTSNIVRGIECDFVRIKIREIDFYLEQGYVRSPLELIKTSSYTEEYLNGLHYKKVDSIAKEMGITTEGNKFETIKLILEAQ